MARVQHNCTGCVPIDASIIEVYTQLISTESRAEEAAERAEHAAEHAIGKSPYIGENGDWWEWNDEQAAFIDTGVQAQGQVAVDIEMSTTSTNPVQNRVVTAAVNEKYTKPATGIPATDIAEGVIPDVSQFITASVNNLVNYYLKSETYNKTEVDSLISAVSQFSYEVVATLPTASASTMYKIYLVPSARPETQNVKDEYITIRSGSVGSYTYAWEQIGSTAIDLSGYVTTQQLNTALSAYTTTANLATLLAAKQDVIADLATIRSGAASGATAYQKPSGGIPKSDLASGVQGSLDLADSAIQARPQGEITPVITPADYATREELGELEAKVDYLRFAFENGTSGAYINVNGWQQNTWAAGYISDYIPVKAGDIVKAYCAADNDALVIAFYNSDKSFVASGKVVGTSATSLVLYTSTAPQDGFVRCYTDKTHIATAWTDSYILIASEIIHERELDDVVSGLVPFSATRNSVPYTKLGAYIDLSGASIGNAYTFADVTFSPFAYWVVPCEEGDTFVLTTTSNTASAQAYAILDANNIVLALRQNAVTGAVVNIPSGAKTILINSGKDTHSVINELGRIAKTSTIAKIYEEFEETVHFSATRKEVPYTKNGAYLNLDDAVIGSAYTFVEETLSVFAYWVVPCEEGDIFNLTTTNNTSSAKSYAILGENDIVISMENGPVAEKNIVIPSGGEKLIINSGNTTYSVIDELGKLAKKSELDRLSTRVDNLSETADPAMTKPLAGVSFGDAPQNLKDAITAVWLVAVNRGNVEKVIQNAPTLHITTIINAAGNYRPYVSICVTTSSSTEAFHWYYGNIAEPRTAKEKIFAYSIEPYNTQWELSPGGTSIGIEIDWSKLQNFNSNSLDIILTTADLPRLFLDDVSLSDVSGATIQNSLNKKTVVCFGDSITEFSDTSGLRYSDYLALFTDANIVNVGIGGSSLQQRTSPVDVPTSATQAYAALDVVNMIDSSIEQDFTKQIAAAEYLRDNENDNNTETVSLLSNIDWENVSAVTIFAGTNDWYRGTGLGTPDEVSKDTTLGAVNYIIQNLLVAYPHINIFWVTPIVRWVNYSSGTGTVANWGGNLKVNNVTLKEFSELIKTEVEKYGIPVEDLYNTLGWNMYNFSNYFTANDGTHPFKPAGMRAIGARLAAFLQNKRNF